MSRATFASRLKGAVARIQQSDAPLAGELESVRSSRGSTRGLEAEALPESLPSHPSLPDDLVPETIVLRTGRPVLAVRNDAPELVFQEAESEVWRDRLKGAVVAIGNAPTALFRLLELIDEGAPMPAAVIGLPVGFVGAAESKAALAENGRLPFLIVRGRKGGSAMAVAAVNALASEQE